jgi:hypothetical protein
VIPTKDRYGTLLPTLRALLAHIPDPELEIVVHDNSADNGPALAFLREVADDRLVYVHLPGSVSIVENTEPALARATGDYLTFIGDDDLVAPDIVEVARALRAAGVDAANGKPAYWWWPTVVFSHPGRFHQPGAFWYPPSINGPARWLDTEAERHRVLAQGAPAMFDLPRVYHGVVSRAALQRLCKRTGRFLNGASPDIALAFGLSYVIDRHLSVDYPLTIFGASRHSGGGFTAERRHHGRIADQKHLPRSTIEHWNPRLPSVWSEHTIYPQTVGEVQAALEQPDELDYTAFYASMLVNEPHLRYLVRPLAMAHLRKHPSEAGRYFHIVLVKAVGRFKRALQAKAVGLPYKLHRFETPDQCMIHLARSSCALDRIRDARAP